KDETPGVLIDFLTLVQRGLHAQVTTVRTDKGTEFLNKTLHAYFDELPQMVSDHVNCLSPGPQSQENVPQVAETVTTSSELELLYSPMFSELLNGTSHVMSKSSAVHVADNPDKRQQHHTTHTSTATDVADPPPLNIHSTLLETRKVSVTSKVVMVLARS
ncbi:hypothetical protein Tco_0302221, partial [Tanacetum coccineum]